MIIVVSSFLLVARMGLGAARSQCPCLGSRGGQRSPPRRVYGLIALVVVVAIVPRWCPGEWCVCRRLPWPAEDVRGGRDGGVMGLGWFGEDGEAHADVPRFASACDVLE